MNQILKPAHDHSGHAQSDSHSAAGGCCGGAEAKPQATADAAPQHPAADSKTKPAGSSGCCCG
ncbi:hypothetical protein [Cypionkella psychrotolerans]|uniref:hypothetical protein n=1 Tax=Cypionkella psychrotolerans TaxID=1678131 RepID=UPI0006B6663C|nr:hypothetical protein [Cypionkella psychrotolerans]